jgi:hypothetical protein
MFEDAGNPVPETVVFVPVMNPVEEYLAMKTSFPPVNGRDVDVVSELYSVKAAL